MASLTAAEKAWIRKVNKLLAECPSKRLGFYTIGDPCVEIYDRDQQVEIDAIMDSGNSDFAPAVDKCDAYLGRLQFPNNVHSTAG